MTMRTGCVFEKTPLTSKRPRARRYPFVANIELTDLQTEIQMTGQTRDLSLFGCSVVIQKAVPTGTSVRVRIFHSRGNVTALGRVAYVKQSKTMGVVFTKIEPNHALVLERWIAESRNRRA